MAEPVEGAAGGELPPPPPPPECGGVAEEEEEAPPGHPDGPLPTPTPPCCAQAVLVELPPEPPAPPPPARGHSLRGNWQEERATNDLDCVPSPRDGTEGFYYRHGHTGLLTLRFLSGLAKSTTMKDSYQRPWQTGLPVRGQREAMMEWLLYQKYSTEAFEENVHPPNSAMESLSTTHRDYCQEGFLSVPPAPTKAHNYRTEQPQTFWLEHARQVPGVSNIRTGDTPFRKNTAFSTPTTESLDEPMPYSPENYTTP